MLRSSLKITISMCEFFFLFFLSFLPCSQAPFVLGGLLLNLCVITQPAVCNG